MRYAMSKELTDRVVANCSPNLHRRSTRSRIESTMIPVACIGSITMPQWECREVILASDVLSGESRGARMVSLVYAWCPMSMTCKLLHLERS